MKKKIYDPETGFPIEVSEEYYEQYMKLWEIAKPKLDGVRGQPVVFSGTGGDFDCKSLKEMFFNPSSKAYEIKHDIKMDDGVDIHYTQGRGIETRPPRNPLITENDERN